MGVIAVCGLVFLGILGGVAAWLIMSDEDDPDSMASYWDEDGRERGEYRSDRTDRE